ncbi:MAG TPA: hypothetical protein VHH34_20665, partial [Pseudonocardiaceae bacterium]|nr:hypothetical protein [Pseudonocardiaceae bacterium]
MTVEPRTAHRPWFYTDSITLTDREIMISVRRRRGTHTARTGPRGGRPAGGGAPARSAPRTGAHRRTGAPRHRAGHPT